MNQKSLDNDPVKRTFDECVREGLNPNPNPPSFIPPMSEEEISRWAGAIFDKFRTKRVKTKV